MRPFSFFNLNLGQILSLKVVYLMCSFQSYEDYFSGEFMKFSHNQEEQPNKPDPDKTPPGSPDRTPVKDPDKEINHPVGDPQPPEKKKPRV